jgi:hypothetical protein
MIHRWVNWCVALGMGAVALAPKAARADRYYIGETTDFSGNGCENEDLNEITASLRNALDNDSWWSGSRYVNVQAWPHDLVEACSSGIFGAGLDSTYGDTRELTVYAGHGNSGALQWGYKRNGMCAVDFASSGNVGAVGVMRLGQMSGATTVAAMWLTSCTLKRDRLASKANFQWVRQQFGYHNSPSIGDDTPSEFYIGVWPTSNKDSWLDHMEDKPGLWTGDNSPIVVSYGETAAEATSTHNGACLKRQILFHRTGGPSCGKGPPLFFFTSTLRDHGTSSGCN